MAKEVFDALGAKTTCIGNHPSGTNINLACGSTHIDALQTLVVKEGLDIGFAFDGDGDRLICVDHTGGVVDGDGVLYLLALHLQEKGELTGAVVGTKMTNSGLEAALKTRGIPLARTEVGDRFVYEYMQKHGSSLGGEPSGHVILSKYGRTGDGLLTSIKLLEAIQKTGLSLHACLDGLHLLPLCQLDIPTPCAKRILSHPKVSAGILELQDTLVGTGRLLVRGSGTEPKIRVMCEGPTQALCEEYCHRVRALILECEDR